MAADNPETPTAAAAPTPPETDKGWRSELRSFIEFFALCGIAVVQPLLDSLSKNAGIFVSAHASAMEAVLLVVLIALVPPFVFWTIEVVAVGIVPRARPVLHALLMAVIVGVIALEVVKRSTTFGSTTLVLIAVAAVLVGAVLLLRVRMVREYLRLLAFSVPVFSMLFLAASPVTSVVFKSSPGATAAQSAGTPHRVVLVVMDELPEMSLLDGTGRIDPQLFPNFAQLEGESTFYRNDTTVSSFTSFAVPAILTGNDPRSVSDVPDVSSYPKNLFTLLGSSYKMNVHEVITHLCPANLCEGTSSAGGFGSLVSDANTLFHQLASPSRAKPNPLSFGFCGGSAAPLRVASSFIQSLQPSRGPELDFVHIELPHQPWHLLGSLQDTGCSRYNEPVLWSGSDPSTRQRHLLQLQAADTLLGRILVKLKSVGALDDSLLIVTADHGVAFTPGTALRGVEARNYPQIMWTPLLVKYPGQTQPRVDDRVAESVDITPTIADVLHVQTSWTFDGRSLLGPERPDGARPIFNWGGSALDQPYEVKLPNGVTHLEFNGHIGFATVVKARGVSATGDPKLRIYRSVEYGSLVGTPVATTTGTPTPSLARVTRFGHPFDDVDPFAHDIPWAYGQPVVAGFGGAQYIAIALNGTIVSVSHLTSAGSAGATFQYIIPPSLVKAGHNDARLYLVTGPTTRPVLEPVSSTS